MSHKWPLVFVHSDESPLDRFFIARAIAQARHANPETPIHLLCDLPYEFNGLCHQHSWKPYQTSSKAFANRYQHLSANPDWYDRACIQRWLILDEFCKLNGISSLIYVESDNLIYSDLSAMQDRFSKSAMSLSFKMSSPINFISDTSVLSAFATFVMDFYEDTNAERRFKLCQEINEGQWPGWIGISDMTLLYFFGETYEDKGEFFQSTESIVDGGKFDHNINMNESGELMGPVRKQIDMHGDTPFARLSDGSFIRMHSLHFQGAKHPMQDFFVGGEDPAQTVELSRSVDIGVTPGGLIALSDRATHKHLGEGWAGAEPAGVCARGKQSVFLFDLTPEFHGKSIICTLEITNTYSRVPWVTEVRLFGKPIAELNFTENGMRMMSFAIPTIPGTIRYRLSLHHEDPKSPMELGISPNDWRDVTVFVYSIRFDCAE